MCGMKLIFFGTSEFAVPALDALVAHGMPPNAVITLPDRPQGRGLNVKPSPVSIAAEAHHLPIYKPERIREASFIDELTALRPDVGVVVAYGKLIPETVIALFPKGILNIHPSLLPEFRGPSPIQSAILGGASETGVSVMLLDSELDHGPVIAKEKEVILPDDTSETLGARLAKKGAELLIIVVPKWLAGSIKGAPQDHSRATFTKRLQKDSGHIDWNESAKTLERKIRAYNPWPGTFSFAKRKEGTLRIKIIRGHVRTPIRKSDKPAVGALFTWEGALAVSAEDGVVILDEVQPEFKQKMTGKSFISGYEKLINSRLF